MKKKWIFAWLTLALGAWGALAQAQGTGPVLVGTFPRQATIVHDVSQPNGDYMQTLLVDDGVTITTGRWSERLSAEQVLGRLYPDAKDVRTLETAPIAAYPATRMRFSYGGNQDENIVDLVTFETGMYTFFFASAVPAGRYDGEDGYADLVDFWIGSLDVFDPEEAGASS